MLKHGVDNFAFEVIYQSCDKDYTKNIMENHFIIEYNSFNNGYNMTLGGDGGSGMTSENSSKYNKERVAKGTHNFLTDTARKKASETAKKTNARLIAIGQHYLQSPEHIKLTSELQSQKVANSEHYWQTEESKKLKRELMMFRCNRPILKELQVLYKQHKLNAHNLHTWTDDKILFRINELQIQIDL